MLIARDSLHDSLPVPLCLAARFACFSAYMLAHSLSRPTLGLLLLWDRGFLSGFLSLFANGWLLLFMLELTQPCGRINVWAFPHLCFGSPSLVVLRFQLDWLFLFVMLFHS